MPPLTRLSSGRQRNEATKEEHVVKDGKLREPVFSNRRLAVDRQKSDICLNIIVKNEAPVIERLFRSVSPVIDYFVVVDTGSSDGTPELILDLACRYDIPGEIHFREWVNFAHNRQQALEIAVAAAKGKWLLLIDADEELKIDDHALLKKLRPGVSYQILKHQGSFSWPVLNLLDISENQWQWKGAVHEYIAHLTGSNRRLTFEHASILVRVGQGARSVGLTERDKYLRDAAVLEKELTQNPKDARSRFYLAQSYRDAGEAVKALKHYSIRANMGGWREEVFYSLYQIAKLKERLGHSIDEVLDSYAKATAAQPFRLEAIHAATRFCRVNKLFERGYDIAKSSLDIKPTKGALFLERWVYCYALLDEFAVCAYWTGRFHECRFACQRILECGDIDKETRKRVESNLRFAQEKCNADGEDRVLVEGKNVGTDIVMQGSKPSSTVSSSLEVHEELVNSLTSYLNGLPSAAVHRLTRIMSEYPYCEYSMGLYLTGLRANLSKQRDTIRESGRVLKGKFILGLGTGRSGSTTLTHIFAAQKNTYCSHEHPPIIDWRGGERQVSFHLERMEILAQSFAAVVDVSHWWLPKLKSVVHRIPGVRVVIIKRDRAGTIGSFTRIKGGFNRQPINHWMEHDGIKFQYNLWDACYPKYDANSLDEALGYYWDDYYATAEKLQSEFPFNVRIFNLEELSSELGQREILEFCDFEDPVLLSGQKFNKGTISDGASLWGNPFEVSTTE